MSITQEITVYTGVVPDRSQPEAEFETNVPNFLNYIDVLAPELNTLATEINSTADSINSDLSDVEGVKSDVEDLKDETLGYKDEAEGFKDSAEAAAIAAGEGAGLPSGGNDGDVLTLTDSVAGTVAFQSSNAIGYSEPNPPSVDTNPTQSGAMWIDNVTGELFVCVENTSNANVWAGQYGNRVEPFDDGSIIDGLTYSAMVSAGNYDATTDTGYFGEVSSATLMTGDALASDIGLTAGTSQHSSEGWLKFYVGANADCNYYKRLINFAKPYVIYIAKKPYRHTVSWDNIYARGAVYGSGDTGINPSGTPTLQRASVTKSGKTLTVRLVTGVDEDPMDFYNKGCAANVAGKSEWNQLFYRIHIDVPVCPTADNYDGGPQVGGNWANFTNSDVVVGSGDGRYAWTQETRSAATTFRASRGYFRVSYLDSGPSSTANSNTGWRPSLVLAS